MKAMTQTAPKVTDAMTPREVGVQMARLREQFGLSPQEVSERLHIRARYISAMEEARYELMPGKAYARGYMHSYADFLGMDADEVVAKCFANEAPVAPVAPPPSTRTAPSVSLSGSPWRSYAVMAVVALVALLLFTQVGSVFSSSKTEEARVAPVPDAMLSSVRNRVMPTANNHECLTSDSVLGCFFADDTTRTLSHLNGGTQSRFGGDIDVSGMAVALPEEAATHLEEDTKKTDE
jgi:transcriptional regulator with XRE-family HTH domain